MVRFYSIGTYDFCETNGDRYTCTDGMYIIKVPSRARMASRATVAVPVNANVVVIRAPYNARASAYAEGDNVLWQYADGHGMTLITVLKPGRAYIWIPGHHRHGPGRAYYVNVYNDLSIALEPAVPPGVTTIG